MTQIEQLEWNESCKEAIEQIRNSPIILSIGKYSCSVQCGMVRYFKWIKKQHPDIVSIETNNIGISGGLGDSFVYTRRCQTIYIDNKGNQFTELDYWDNQEVSKEEWA